MYTVPGIALDRPARRRSRSPRRRAGARPLLRNGTSRTGATGAQAACGSATLHAGDTPRPSGVGPPPIPRFEEASRKMERHPKQLHVRMSDREMESAKGLARELGMTVSDLVRVLLQLPAEEVRGEARLVVVDRMNLNLPGSVDTSSPASASLPLRRNGGRERENRAPSTRPSSSSRPCDSTARGGPPARRSPARWASTRRAWPTGSGGPTPRRRPPEDNPFKVAEENRRLRRENERLKRENEILLKASAFFASRQL